MNLDLLIIAYVIVAAIELCCCQLVVEVPFNGDETDCPDGNSKLFNGFTKYIPWSVPFRAYLTIPDGLRVGPSKIPGAGMGVISETFIAANTWLAEYAGEILPESKTEDISWYTWTGHRDGDVTHYIDAENIETSNYLRWVNCARNKLEENVVVMECKGKIYYKTSQDIYPEQELLVYYGSTYAVELNIDTDLFGY